MYSQLGEIVFEGLLGPHGSETETATDYAEIKILNSKADLQKLGLALDVITLQLRLHHTFCDPPLIYARLEDARINGTVLPYVDGYGNLKGDYVIEKMKKNTLHEDYKGYEIFMECEVVLKEYVNPNRKLQKAMNAKRNAFALEAVTPPALQIKTPPPSAEVDIMVSMKQISNGGATAAENVKKAQSNAAAAKTYWDAASKGAETVRQGADNMAAKLRAYQTQLDVTEGVIQQAERVKDYALNLASALPGGDNATIATKAEALSGSITGLTSLTLPVQKLIILR